MKRLLLLIFILSTVRLSAQERFSLLLDQNGINQLSTGIEIKENGEYIMPCYSTDFFSIDTFTYAKTYALWFLVSSNGTIKSMHSYRKSYFSIDMRGIVKAGNSNFIIVGNSTDLVKYKKDTSGQDIYLVKINSNGDTLWTKSHPIIEGHNKMVDVINTSDGEIAIIGHLQNKKKTNSDIFLLKIDTLGNIIFSKSYTFSSNSHDGGYSLCETPNKEFFILGEVDDNACLIKTDSLGNKQWHKLYGLDGKRWLGSAIVKTKNNEYIIAGGVRTASSTSGDGWIKRLDSAGNVIWQKTYGGNGFDGINSLEELPSGDIIAVGSNASYDNPDNKNEGWIMKLDALGNVLWERIYGLYHISNDSLTNSIFYNFKSTTDGGFAIVGSATRKDSPQKQDSWLLKLDSFGCLTSGCQSVGIDNIPFSREEIKIYPNPAKDKIQIQHSGKALSYRIADYTGKLLMAGNYVENGINVEQLPNGVYIVQVLLENKSQAFGRLMIEK